MSNNTPQTASNNNTNGINTLQPQSSNVSIIAKDEHESQNPTPVHNPENNTTSVITGSHQCDLCLKSFQFRYQLIVHRRYHNEKKPFTCQVRQLIWFRLVLTRLVLGVRKSISKQHRTVTARQMSFRWQYVYVHYLFSRVRQRSNSGKAHEKTFGR